MMETGSEYRLGKGRECSGGRLQWWCTGLLRKNGISPREKGTNVAKAWWCWGRHWICKKAGNSLWLESWVLEHSGQRLRSWIKSGFRFAYLNEFPVNMCQWMNEPSLSHAWSHKTGVFAWQPALMRYRSGGVMESVSFKIIHFLKVYCLLGPRIWNHPHSFPVLILP